jgi:hypothetical protein
VISDLHLGSRGGRDVLRRPAALDRLLEALDGVDRLVLLGDTVELAEGRPVQAMHEAEPVVRAIGEALGDGKQVVMVPGNHDRALIRPWLRERRESGKPIGTTARVPLRSSPDLGRLSRWLRPARLQVRYPAADLGDGIWAHHGHYLDRHLSRRSEVEEAAEAMDYERVIGASLASLTSSLPPAMLERLQRAGRLARGAGAAARPLVAGLPGGAALAPFTAAALGFQFRRAGLPAMDAVAARLAPARTEQVIFGHLHRLGPLDGDDPDEWLPETRQLWNSGSWVYEPMLLSRAKAPHPYWPGGALQIADGRITVLSLLDDLDHDELG